MDHQRHPAEGRESADEFQVDNGGATENMTQDPAGLEEFVPAPEGLGVEGTSTIVFPVAGY